MSMVNNEICRVNMLICSICRVARIAKKDVNADHANE